MSGNCCYFSVEISLLRKIHEVLGPHLSYYWTMWQSEWATDLIFSSPEGLNSIRDSLLRHAHMTGTSTRVLRYLDRPLTIAGKPYARSKDEVLTRVTDFNDGIRVRHWVDNNRVKVYNEQNVLRVETTINNPGKFRVFRYKQGQSPDESKSRLPLRKGVMDIPLRAIISQEVNDRFMNDLSMLQDESPAHKLIDEITCHLTQDGRRFRALDPTGKDRELLQLIGNPAFRISGLTNKMLRQNLSDTHFGSGRTDKQLSAKITRHLRLLRAHGIIRKLPKQNRYQLTFKGIKLTNILNAFLAAFRGRDNGVRAFMDCTRNRNFCTPEPNQRLIAERLKSVILKITSALFKISVWIERALKSRLADK